MNRSRSLEKILTGLREDVSLVEAAAGKELSARGEGDAVHRLLVPAHHARQCQHSQASHDANRRHHQYLPHWHVHHIHGQPCQCVDAGSFFHVPQTHSGIKAGRGKHLKIKIFPITNIKKGEKEFKIIFKLSFTLTKFMFGFCVPGPVGLHLMV